MGWDEDDLHRWLARAPRPEAFVGSMGNDAAVVRRPAGRLVTCLDQCVEGVHAAHDVAPAALGRKAANRALSDLAATAATPLGLLLGLSAPADRTPRWMRAAIGGVRAAAEQVDAELWGGDLAAADGPARLSVTAIGELRGHRAPVGRDRARVGQWVLCTGPLGGSLLGRHLRFAPRIDAGHRLARAGATAMMDVSDGLAWDVYRLARASGVRVEIDAVPVHRDATRRARVSGRSASWHALHDGEDHELVATLAPDAGRAALEAAAERGDPWTRIGVVRRGSGLGLTDEAVAGGPRDWTPGEGGWSHGTRD